MTPSDALERKFEGLKLKAYLCPAGRLTIGRGHTGPDVKPGMVITEARADQLLAADVALAWRDVLPLVAHAAEPATQGQANALTDFVFNHGATALRTSTLLRLHNAARFAEAAAEFIKWDHAHVDGKLVELPGLKARAEAQSATYLGRRA